MKHQIKQYLRNIHHAYQAMKLKRIIQSRDYDQSLIILMYHRVLPKNSPKLDSEEPGMYVTPETFDMHLKEIKQIATLIHIEEWLDLAEKGKLKNTLYCAVTFDDGWADNYEYAFPTLIKENAPATIFLATNYIGSESTFWPERLAEILNDYHHYLQPLTGLFGEINISLDTQKLSSSSPSIRKHYVSQLIQCAKQYTEQELYDWLEITEQGSKMRVRDMLNWDEVRALAKHGIRIGGHTRSHLRLNDNASAPDITNEIIGCYDDIASATLKKPTQFCYPNGDVSSTALDIVKQHFKLAVTTKMGLNKSYTNPHELNRVGLHEDISNTPTKFKSTLSRAF